MAAVLALGLCGCVVPDPNPTESGTAPEGTETEPMPEGNGLFTDAFFADVVEIRDISCGQVFEDQMMPVVLHNKALQPLIFFAPLEFSPNHDQSFCGHIFQAQP